MLWLWHLLLFPWLSGSWNGQLLFLSWMPGIQVRLLTLKKPHGKKPHRKCYQPLPGWGQEDGPSTQVILHLLRIKTPGRPWRQKLLGKPQKSGCQVLPELSCSQSSSLAGWFPRCWGPSGALGLTLSQGLSTALSWPLSMHQSTGSQALQLALGRPGPGTESPGEDLSSTRGIPAVPVTPWWGIYHWAPFFQPFVELHSDQDLSSLGKNMGSWAFLCDRVNQQMWLLKVIEVPV